MVCKVSLSPACICSLARFRRTQHEPNEEPQMACVSPKCQAPITGKAPGVTGLSLLRPQKGGT